jgi:hypothetical protein
VTGIFFDRPEPASLADALRNLGDHFHAALICEHAASFDVSVFKQRMYDVLARRYVEYRAGQAA